MTRTEINRDLCFSGTGKDSTIQTAKCLSQIIIPRGIHFPRGIMQYKGSYIALSSLSYVSRP